VPGQFGTVFCLATLLAFSITVLQGENKKINLCMDGCTAFDPFFVLSLQQYFLGMTTVLWWNKTNNQQSTCASTVTSFLFADVPPNVAMCPRMWQCTPECSK